MTIFLAAVAKYSAARLLSAQLRQGLTVVMMVMRALPASAGCRMRVSLESRYGTCLRACGYTGMAQHAGEVDPVG